MLDEMSADMDYQLLDLIEWNGIVNSFYQACNDPDNNNTNNASTFFPNTKNVRASKSCCLKYLVNISKIILALSLIYFGRLSNNIVLDLHFYFSVLDKIIVQGYKALQLQYFFTAGPDEVKAWTIQVIF